MTPQPPGRSKPPTCWRFRESRPQPRFNWVRNTCSEQQEIYLNANEPMEKAVTKSFASLAQMLLSSNEFLYVD